MTITLSYLTVYLFRNCLHDFIVHSDKSVIQCPLVNGNVQCQCVISEREISFVSEDIFNTHNVRFVW